MPDYGVPEDADGLLSWDWAERRLVESRNYWVATASGSGRPHLMPVWGWWDVEGERFVFTCGDRARKAANIRANPQVTVAVDDTVEVVSIEGVAREVAGDARMEPARALGDKYGHEMPPDTDLVAFMLEVTMFEVLPQRGFSVIERPDDFGPRATRWDWS